MTDVNVLRGKDLKTGDTYPDLRAKLLDDGNPFNLEDYDVMIKMRRTDSDELLVDESASVEIPNRGIVTYDWGSNDTDTSGVYLLEFVADDGNGSTVSFPNKDYTHIYIEDRL